MEMVAASKMRKAIEAVLKTRTYANLSWETVLRLAKLAETKSEDLHPLLAKRAEIKRAAVQIEACVALIIQLLFLKLKIQLKNIM